MPEPEELGSAGCVGYLCQIEGVAERSSSSLCTWEHLCDLLYVGRGGAWRNINFSCVGLNSLGARLGQIGGMAETNGTAALIYGEELCLREFL